TGRSNENSFAARKKFGGIAAWCPFLRRSARIEGGDRGASFRLPPQITATGNNPRQNQSIRRCERTPRFCGHNYGQCGGATNIMRSSGVGVVGARAISIDASHARSMARLRRALQICGLTLAILGLAFAVL